ncbi:hypothetical protein [Tissierella praeacuta]|uniref:hypothetical protein n=1 Tax=Tissierella praeacuta TaxID=43131 RepID=UPI00334039A0
MFTKIDELIWTDEKYKSLSDDGKFLFLYVLSCPHRNILGFYFLPIPYGSFDLGWENERFTKGLKELLSNGFINYNFNTNIIFIKNFLKYNPLENPNQVKGAIKALQVLPTNSIDTELVDYLKTVDKPFIEPLLKRLDERLGKQEDVDVDVEVDVKEDIDKDIDKENIIIMSDDESKFINILSKIPNFPLDRERDLEMYKTMQERYPTLNLIEAIEDWRQYKLDKPLTVKSNPRSQINTSFKNYVKWGKCLKKAGASNGKYIGDIGTENQGSERKVDLSHIGFKGTGEIDDSDLI